MASETMLFDRGGIKHNIALVDTVGWASSNPRLTKDVIFTQMVKYLASM
jgi:hypothetical protein